MSEQTDTSVDDEGEQRVTVRRLTRANGMTARQITRAVRAALDGRSAELSVAIVDDATIASLHERYLNDATPTDVLAFDLRDGPEPAGIEGEIVVSAETARRQAAELGVDAGEELLRYAVHGTLHLMGQDDHTPAGRRHMRQAEDRILAGLSAAGPSANKRPASRRTT